jgi:peptidyl-prolyl cis-trans isomerase SurA
MNRCVFTALLVAAFLRPCLAGDGELLDRIVAVVENDIITQSELDQRVHVIERQYGGSATQLPPPAQLERQVLNRMVIESLQLQMAETRGIRIDDLTLNAAMQDLAKSNNMSLPGFRDRLVAEGIDYPSFREQVRNELIMSTLRDRVIGSQVQVTDEEIDELLATQASNANSGVQYYLRHILIALPEGASSGEIQAAFKRAKEVRKKALAGANFAQLAVNESDSSDALEGGDFGWRTAAEMPTLFARDVTTMHDGDTSEIIRSPSGFHIIQMEGRRGGQQTIVDQTRARHILITPNALESDEEARQRLEDLRNRIEAGADFAELAEINSDDKTSAVDGGDLGWISSGQMASGFEQVMNSLRIGQISEPFHSQFGWHIVQVTDRRQHDSTVELQRGRAAQAIRQRKMEEETELWLRRLRDESYVEYRLEPPDSGAEAASRG